MKIALGLKFTMEHGGDDEINYLDQFCGIIELKTGQVLDTLLKMENPNHMDCNVDEVKRILDQYSGMRNFVLQILYEEGTLEYIQKDGEKEQLLVR